MSLSAFSCKCCNSLRSDHRFSRTLVTDYVVYVSWFPSSVVLMHCIYTNMQHAAFLIGSIFYYLPKVYGGHDDGVGKRMHQRAVFGCIVVA